jgi:hypothetical protein
LVVACSTTRNADCVGFGAEELRPCRPGSLWRRVDPGGGEDLLDGRGVDLVAEAGEFAVNASITTGRVLAGQVDCQCPQVGWGGWPTRVGGGWWFKWRAVSRDA